MTVTYTETTNENMLNAPNFPPPYTADGPNRTLTSTNNFYRSGGLEARRAAEADSLNASTHLMRDRDIEKERQGKI